MSYTVDFTQVSALVEIGLMVDFLVTFQISPKEKLCAEFKKKVFFLNCMQQATLFL